MASLPQRIEGRSAARVLLALAALLFAGAGVRCDPGAIEVTNRPPDPRLVDEDGRVHDDGFAAVIAAVEEGRGLGFIQRPTLELLAADDARLASLRANERALEPCPPATPVSREAEAEGAAPGACFPDPGLERVLCLAPPDLESARRVLRRLLEAQNHPRLVRLAPELRGDPGIAIRALLAASASGAGPVAGADDPDAPELFDRDALEIDAAEPPTDACVGLGIAFLASQPDREAPFRTPPLSTKQLASPRAYRASERPYLLVGAPPGVAACAVASDESVGVARLLLALTAKGGPLPGAALAGWLGDRGVVYACADESPAWIYVVELSDENRAAAFAARIATLLPAAFAQPADVQRAGRRVVASRGVAPQQARAWAASLAAEELVRIDESG